MAWKWRPWVSQPPLAYQSTGKATSCVSTSMSAESRSITSTMPKGAGQSPRRYTCKVPSLAWLTKETAIHKPSASDSKLMRRPHWLRACAWPLGASPSNSSAIAVNAGSSTGRMGRCCVQKA